MLATGRPTFDRGTLTVALPAGRPLAEGRRALSQAAVVEQLTRHYGDSVEVVVEALPDTGTQGDRQKALTRKVLAQPEIQRAQSVLGAKLLRVVPLEDGV